MNIKITPEKELFWEKDKGLGIFDDNPIYIPKNFGLYAKKYGIKRIRGKGKDRKITYDCNFCSLTIDELKQLGLKYWGSNRAPILSDYIETLDKIQNQIYIDNEKLNEESIWLYHSTSYDNAINIIKNGMKLGTGIFGFGGYFEYKIHQYSYSQHYSEGISVRIKIPKKMIIDYRQLWDKSKNLAKYINTNLHIPTQIEDFVTQYGCYFDDINEIRNSYDSWGKMIQLFMLSNGIQAWQGSDNQIIIYDQFYLQNEAKFELFEISKTKPIDKIIEGGGCNELYQKEIDKKLKKKTNWTEFDI